MMRLSDDLGRVHSFPAPARRIISLSPAIAENLFAIGAGSRVVGVTSVDDYPAPVQKLPRIGDFGAPLYERIRALRPDLAVVEIAKIDRATIENAEKRMQVPIFVQMSRRYDDVPRHLTQLGEITGTGKTAQAAGAKMRQTATQVNRQVQGKPKTTVFIEVSSSPLYAVGPGSFLDDLIRLSGGINVVEGDNPFPQFSRERLLTANPAHYVIAVGGDMKSSPKPTLPAPLDRIQAAKTGNIHRIPADHLFRPTPRLARGLVELARALHG
ncbi:MAG: cobalamin-binding protein [Armatimonadaceae bacterium]